LGTKDKIVVYSPNIAIYNSATGGSPLSPADITFSTPTAALANQVISIYIENIGTSTIPANALVSACMPNTTPSGVNVFEWRRNVQANVLRNILFSLDNIDYRPKINLPALSVGLAAYQGVHQVHLARSRIPIGSTRATTRAMSYPGDADDWPPIMGVQIDVVNKVMLFDGFETWQTTDTVDDYLIVEKWDQIYLQHIGDTNYINYGGGRRGGKAYQVTHRTCGLEIFDVQKKNFFEMSMEGEYSVSHDSAVLSFRH
jgi:hypothetical protein